MKNNREKEISKNLKKILGFKPRNIELYQTAFIHKSATFINHEGQTINNERLEFLGDAILDAVISDHLYKKYPNFDEGKLTQTRSKLVNTRQLSVYNKLLGINTFLEVHTTNTLNKKHLYADSFEAFIGAIFLDKGFKKTYTFILKNVFGNTDLEELINTEINHKSRLLELSQKNNFNIEFITLTNEEDGQNFISKIFLDQNQIAFGYGNTKKEAEQNAAHEAMIELNPNYNNGKKNH